MSSDESVLQDVVAALHRVGLEAIVVGTVAGVLNGAPVMTQDLDLLVRDTPKNREKIGKLSAALRLVDASRPIRPPRGTTRPTSRVARDPATRRAPLRALATRRPLPPGSSCGAATGRCVPAWRKDRRSPSSGFAETKALDNVRRQCRLPRGIARTRRRWRLSRAIAHRAAPFRDPKGTGPAPRGATGLPGHRGAPPAWPRGGASGRAGRRSLGLRPRGALPRGWPAGWPPRTGPGGSPPRHAQTGSPH